MKISTSLRRSASAFVTTAALISSSLLAPAAHAEPETVFSLVSSPTSYAGGGESLTYYAAAAQRFDARTFGTVGYVNFWIVAAPGIFWTIDVGTPNYEPFHLGRYDNADSTRDETPFVAFGDSGRGTSGTGWFDILDFAYNPDGSLSRFAADLETFDNGVPDAWNYVSVRYNSEVPLTAGPPAPIPEPSTYALLAAGLLVVGLVAHRGRGA